MKIINRFLETAEMLRPTISNLEDELTDHFPHLILLHNKAQMDDFTPTKFKLMQQVIIVHFGNFYTYTKKNSFTVKFSQKPRCI